MSNLTSEKDIGIQSYSRITIMDGEVVTFAESFELRPGIIGPLHEARGPFEISASRNCVTIHRAELRSDADVERFSMALREAQVTARHLTREGWGGNYRTTGTPGVTA